MRRARNQPGYGDNTIVEHVFALLLALSHRFLESVERARAGRFSPEGLQGYDLAGKTLGVIGAESIGRHVISIDKGLRMEVLVYDVTADSRLAEHLGFNYVTFDELLTRSDVITLHVPATPKTRHLLSAKTFGRMKDGVVGSHLGMRISNFAPKKPSNVRISTKNILTFDGFLSLL